MVLKTVVKGGTLLLPGEGLVPGSVAVVDLKLEKTVSAAMLKGHADFSLYEGQALKRAGHPSR